ncbi:MAG: NAD(P)-dependent oxidoreductase [Rhodospirillales bacterium]|jgi:3-hydroxyisobutyrate dehydrogenase-like beta-hydroxyacid dehydrogenase|nr:NAD(P)-dependent oxidoreductase [Rhodospirillales bacterium]
MTATAANTKVAFIGLGNMGYPMAGHLAKAGYRVTVYNRTAAKAKRWAAEFGGDAAETPKAAATDAEFVFTCVGNDDDLRSVALGESGVLVGLGEGALYADHSTVSADVARELDAAARTRRGVAFLDAPVSGGQAGAENGVLTIMVGGDEAAFSRAEPVMRVYGRAVTLMGPVGAGQLTKMVNQIAVVGVVQGLAEAVHFAKAAGLDVGRVVDVISKGAAQSWQMENRAMTMAKGEFDFGFAVDWMRKDLGIVIDEARRNGATLPVTAVIEQFYARLQAQGGGRWDSSSLIKLLAEG